MSDKCALGIFEIENRMQELLLFANTAEHLKNEILGSYDTKIFGGFDAAHWADYYCFPFLLTLQLRLMDTCEVLETVVEKLKEKGYAGTLELTTEEKAELQQRREAREEEADRGDYLATLRAETLEVINFAGEDNAYLYAMAKLGRILKADPKRVLAFIEDAADPADNSE